MVIYLFDLDAQEGFRRGLGTRDDKQCTMYLYVFDLSFPPEFSEIHFSDFIFWDFLPLNIKLIYLVNYSIFYKLNTTQWSGISRHTLCRHKSQRSGSLPKVGSMCSFVFKCLFLDCKLTLSSTTTHSSMVTQWDHANQPSWFGGRAVFKSLGKYRSPVLSWPRTKFLVNVHFSLAYNAPKNWPFSERGWWLVYG